MRRVTVLGVSILMAGLSVAAWSGPASAAAAPVATGVNVAALPGATPFGSTDPSTPESVSFILREQNIGQLEQSAERGISRYDSVSQFAGQYGQSPAVVKSLTSYLAHFGISTSVYADRVDVVANGTAGEFDSALSVTQKQYHVPEVAARNGMASIPAQTIHATTQSPTLPKSIAQYVLAILGLTNYGPNASQAIHADSSLSPPQSSSTNPCLALTGLPDACNTPSNFASNYGLSGLYKKGYNGKGETIAIVTLAALDPGAPQYFWSNVLGLPSTGRSLTVDNVDGGPGAPSDASGTGETDLDVEQSGGLAPGANVVVYQAPNSDPGFADAFFTAASQNIADTVSASWLESETYLSAAIASGMETPAYEAAFDEAFLEMAAQGQSGFIASGDWAAYTATADIGTTNLSVGASGDSPFITSAGGTTLAWSGVLTGPTGTTAPVSVPAQRTWGWDYLWQAAATSGGTSLVDAAESHVIGSGGGFSTVEPKPSYQNGVSGTSSFSAVQYLTPTDFQTVNGIVEPTTWSFNPTPSVSHGVGSGRVQPDLSADADPETGYLLYEPSFATASPAQPVLQGSWGGTSFVAPQLNGSTAVIDQFVGHRVGLWNPAIYHLATGGSSPFTPLNKQGTSSDNIFYTGTPGTVYNQGSGLGTPNLTALAADLR
jgi:kumamolisin